MGMRRTKFNIDQIEHSMPDTALGDDQVGKLAHAFDRSFQHDRLDALIVVKMGMHRRDSQLVMSMLNVGESLSQLSLMMVVDIRKIGDTGALRGSTLGTLLQMRTQNIAHRFAARGIAAFLDEGIEGFGQFFI